MRKRSGKIRRKHKSRHFEGELPHDYTNMKNATVNTKERLGAFYATGPVIALGPERERTGNEPTNQKQDHEEGTAAVARVNQLAPLSTKDHRRDEMAATYGRTIRLVGRTDPGDFTYEAHTEDLRTERATGCEGCSDADCVRVTGTLVTTYSVSPTVTLPSVSDYPDLTPCQQRRVQDAIDSVLAPHEQEHVRAFQTYNGTTRRRFDLTICRSEWNQSTIDDMVRPEQEARQSAAQAASDALDPFHFDVDLNCEDTPKAGRKSQGSDGGELNADTEE